MLIAVATMATPEAFAMKPVGTFMPKAFSVHGLYGWPNHERNIGPVGSYEGIFRSPQSRGSASGYGYRSGDGELIAYLHDDVECREQGWDLRVEKQFTDPHVGVVGFGGALIHGSPDLYKRPYQLQRLGRSHYLSNTDDAEQHGERFTGERDVAVLDGFALIVRRKLLEKAGGWPTQHLTFHCYDYWLCCMAHRLGYKVRMVGVRCHHYGGQTSTSPAYLEWCKAQGTSDQEIHEKAHRWIYDEFRDVLPWRER